MTLIITEQHFCSFLLLFFFFLLKYSTFGAAAEICEMQIKMKADFRSNTTFPQDHHQMLGKYCFVTSREER